jgi:cation diffusion facilitator family transporter
MDREKYGALVSLTGLLCNLFLFAGKLAIAVKINSAAVLAEALNNLTDAVSALALAIGFFVSGKRPDKVNPFGYGRVEYLSGLLIAFFIIATGLEAGKMAGERLLDPHPANPTYLMLFGLLISIFIKLLLGLFYQNANKKLQSQAIQAGLKDSLADAALTGLTLLSLSASSYTTFPIDAVLGFAIAGLIMFTGFVTAKEALRLLLGNRDSSDLELQIRDLVLTTEGIKGIHGLTVHDYGPSRKYATAHVELSATLKFNEVHDLIEQATDSVQQVLKTELVLLPEPLESLKKQSELSEAKKNSHNSEKRPPLEV